MLNRYKRTAWFKIIEIATPSIVKATAKKVVWKIVRRYNRVKHIRKGRFVEFGYRFRFDRNAPYKADIAEKTILEDFNVWNAQSGDIVVGKNCWFGLYNVVMGPVEIGERFSSGQNVMILGPRHPVLSRDETRREKTVIGKNVWVSSGSIILFGVTVGDNAIISAGSVVTRDVAAGAFVGGNPARDLSALMRKAWGMAEPAPYKKKSQ